jgi:hypothetical protein
MECNNDENQNPVACTLKKKQIEVIKINPLFLDYSLGLYLQIDLVSGSTIAEP